jgi:hypothetical protein
LLGGSRQLTASLNLDVAGLQIWDGSAFIPTGANNEQVGLLASTSNVIADTAKTTAAGADLSIAIAAGYTVDAHSSMRYTLLGDGLDPYAASRDGIYLMTLQLSGTQSVPSLSPSAPFYYILAKNVGAIDLTTVVNRFAAAHAISSDLVQYAANVPEPTAASLIVVAAVCQILSRRSRRGQWSTA